MRGAPTADGARILALGEHRPARVVTNDEIAPAIDSSDEWIRERSGIVSRRFAAADESVVDMATAAGAKAVAAGGIAAADVDLVLVATCTHPYQLPAAASPVATNIGAVRAGAADLGAACAGFCYGLALASDAVRAGSARHVLVIGAEKLTDIVDPRDRATAFLFADGAGAALVGPASEPGIAPVAWGSDGSQASLITQVPSWVDTDRAAERAFLRMDGPSVFRWTVTALAPVARRALELAGVTVDDLAAFVPHQANLRIVEAVARSLRLPPHVVVARDIVDTGNTSAASIPLALARLVAAGSVPSGAPALLIGFGAGLTYAAQVVTIP